MTEAKVHGVGCEQDHTGAASATVTTGRGSPLASSTALRIL